MKIKNIAILLTVLAVCVLVIFALKEANQDLQSTLARVEMYIAEDAPQKETAEKILIAEATRATNQLHLGYKKLRELSTSQRARPTEYAPYWTGWSVRPAQMRGIYQIISYAHTNREECINGAWVGALASRTVYVALKP